MSESARTTRGVPRGLALALVAGAWLRVTALDVHSLWFDECGTLAIALADDPLAALRSDRHPPLSFLALRAWIGVFGESDAAVRSLPALLSCATLVLFALWTRRIATAPVALLSTWLLAVAPYQVWMAQEVRMYPFVELGAALVLCGSELATRRRLAGAALVGLGTLLAFGAHYLGICVAGLTLVAGSSWKERRHAALGAAVGMLAWLPWLLEALQSQMQSSWGDTVKLSTRDMLELGPRLFTVEMDVLPERWRVVAYGLGALCWLALTRCAWRSREPGPARMACIATILPVLFTLLTQATVGGGFQTRYLIAATPGAALAVACGLETRRAWTLPVGAGLLALGLGAHSLVLRVRNLREDYRSACAELAREWRPGDRVVSITGTDELFELAPLRHYLRERPEILAACSTWERIETQLDEVLSREARLHVVYRESGYSWAERDRLACRLELVEAGPVRERIERSTWRRAP